MSQRIMFYATKAQVKRIKTAISKHDMRSVTWQSIAARPERIEEFLYRCEVQTKDERKKS